MSSILNFLFLEDEALDVDLIQRHLSRSGMEFTAVVASDRPEFEAALEGQSFDAILADNSLPQFNSIDALEILRGHGLDVPFILVTGTVSEEFAVDILHKGADDYILKDNLTRLPSSIERVIEKRRTQREKALAETALRKSEEQYRLLFDLNPLAAWVVDNETQVFLAVNEAAVQQYGYSYGEFKGMYTEQIQPCYKIDPGMVKHTRKDGSILDAEIVSKEVFYENRAAHLILICDLTQKLKAESEIKQMNQELRELSSHLQNIREEERIQIARDIHDELGQQLTGLKMEVYSLNKKINSPDTAIKEKFSDIILLIDGLVKSVRKIAANLRPSMLDDFGLAAALKWQAQEVETRFGIKINFDSDFPEADIPTGISTGLFRIYQEALTNAVRHANAHVIDSRLTRANERIILEIKDDGKGIDPNAGEKKKSLGLLGIKERVFVMNGSYELKSGPGKGTCLSVSVPLQSV